MWISHKEQHVKFAWWKYVLAFMFCVLWVIPLAYGLLGIWSLTFLIIGGSLTYIYELNKRETSSRKTT
jgi:hypothetical protein